MDEGNAIEIRVTRHWLDRFRRVAAGMEDGTIPQGDKSDALWQLELRSARGMVEDLQMQLDELERKE